MYRYDEFDAAFVRDRVSQFRYQVARRLSGELTEEQFKPLRLMNGLYLQLHAYMLRIAMPYGTLSAKQLRMLAHIARKYDKRLRPFHDAAEHPIQLDQAGGRARNPGGPRQRRNARHPDQRQLHPQCHDRSICRRRRRRDRGPAAALPRSSANGRAASGIRLPAAQIQDRGGRYAA